jgi:hypothetical protein
MLPQEPGCRVCVAEIYTVSGGVAGLRDIQERRFLLELLSELSELLLQIRDFFTQRCDFFFQLRDALSASGHCGCACRWFCLWLEGFHFAGQEMRVAGFLGARLPGKNFDERGLALHQVLQAGLHGAQVVEWMHALGAGAEFAGSLRAAQQQNAENGDFVTIEVEGFLETVLVLGDAAVRGADITDQGLSVQRMQSLADGGFVEIHDRIAVRFLVAGVDQGVQGKWIVFGSGDFFFDERAQDAAFDFVQEDVHGVE